MKYVVTALGILLAGLAGVALASCGAGAGAQSAGPVPTSKVQPAAVPALSGSGTDTIASTLSTGTGSSAGAGAAHKITYQVWFHRGEQLFVVRRTIKATPRVGTAALDSLLAGPSDDERTAGVETQVPSGTQLLALAINKGIATVDLTSEYQAGGGSASMTMRLAQVVCTLDQFPTVRGVLFALDGRRIDVIGGEGIVIDHPLTCTSYDDLLPAILVESPPIGQDISNPVTVSGSANVFEANVTVEIVDLTGHVVGTKFVTATCGTGCRGTFSVTVPYEVNVTQHGTIVVHDDDAAGTGHPPHEVRIPVILEPAS